jgi:hypothetical protein
MSTHPSDRDRFAHLAQCALVTIPDLELEQHKQLLKMVAKRIAADYLENHTPELQTCLKPIIFSARDNLYTVIDEMMPYRSKRWCTLL